MQNSSQTHKGDAFSKLLSSLVAITTILGIPAGLYGYFSSQHASRVSRTFDFYKDFRGDPGKDFKFLVAGWNARAEEEKSLAQKGDEAGVKSLVSSLLTNNQTQTAVTELVLFFDEVYSCVDNSLCDRNTAVALFQSPASQFFSMYGSYFQDVRETNPTYAIGVMKLRNLTKCWSLF
jgi:hypothetical protein